MVKQSRPLAAIIFFKDVMTMSDDINWLECLPWDGDERTLPLGGEIRVPGITIDKLVKMWAVIDPESDEGVKNVRPSQLGRDDVVIGAIMNESLITRIAGIYGERFVLIIDPATKQKLTRREWYEKHGTDGLALWAVRNARMGNRPAFALGRVSGR